MPRTYVESKYSDKLSKRLVDLAKTKPVPKAVEIVKKEFPAYSEVSTSALISHYYRLLKKKPTKDRYRKVPKRHQYSDEVVQRIIELRKTNTMKEVARKIGEEFPKYSEVSANALHRKLGQLRRKGDYISTRSDNGSKSIDDRLQEMKEEGYRVSSAIAKLKEEFPAEEVPSDYLIRKSLRSTPAKASDVQVILTIKNGKDTTISTMMKQTKVKKFVAQLLLEE